MKLIYSASDIIEANIVAGMLHANGIEAHVGGYFLQGGIGELAVQDFANINVADEDVELAESVIKEYEAHNTHATTTDVVSNSAEDILKVVLFVSGLAVVFYYLAS